MKTAPSSCHLSFRAGFSSIELLETRIALDASAVQIAEALDLPAGVVPSATGNVTALTKTAFGTGIGVLGFPAGADGDFLIMSTGNASQVLTLPNSAGNQGSDLPPNGAPGDTATVSFTLAVPASSIPQRLKFDFLFMSDEYPEFVGSSFNDFFTASVNGTNIALDQFGNPVTINNVFFTGEPAAGTFLDGRTSKLTATYVVPGGVTSLNVQFSIGDVGDGVYDSAVFVDNVRFEAQQVVFVDFDGRTVSNHFGAGTVVNFPAFSAADVKSNKTTAEVIADVIAGLQTKYSAYDLSFTTTEPASGDYSVLVLGGDNDLPVDITNASPTLKQNFPGNNTPSLRQVLGLGANSTLFGKAQSVDVGNLIRKDLGVIFSGVFDNFYAAETSDTITDRLVVTTAHELGHNLGLRHVLNDFPADILKKNSPRNSDATFGDAPLTLAENWSDRATEQNDDVYLKSVLGTVGNSLASSFAPLQTFLATFLSQILYNFTLIYKSGGIDAESGVDDSTQTVLHFDQFDGTQALPVPVLPLGATVQFFAASQPGGPIDVFSGTPKGGDLSDAASQLPLFDAKGNFKLSFPMAQGAFGSLTKAGALGVIPHKLGNLPIDQDKKIEFTDDDGDIYVVKLTGPGVLSASLDDPDTNQKGGLSQIVVDGTHATKSSLSVTLKKQIGDGLITLGQVSGTEGAALKSLKAGIADLNGAGIYFTGSVGDVALHDVFNGANIQTGPDAADAKTKIKSSLKAHVVGDGSTIVFGTPVTAIAVASAGDSIFNVSSLGKFTASGDKALALPGNVAADVSVGGFLGSVKVHDLLGTASFTGGGTAKQKTSFTAHVIADGAKLDFSNALGTLKSAAIGDATIEALAVGTLKVTGVKTENLAGDFKADLTLTGGGGEGILGSANIAGQVLGAQIVADHIKSFTADAIVESQLFAGFFPNNASDPLAGGSFDTDSSIKSVTVKALIGGFINSFIGADIIGKIALASATTANGGDRFGVIAGTSIGGVTIKTPEFKYDPNNTSDQGVDDFLIRLT